MTHEEVLRVKQESETDAEFIKSTVDSLVAKYATDLDNFTASVVENLRLASNARTMEQYTDDLLQNQVITLPTVLYFAGNGLEDLGAENSVAEYKRKEVYNIAFAEAHGTIPDKKAQAEKLCENEQFLEEIYDRAYKKPKLKIEHGTRVLESLKKVLDYRITRMSKGRGYDPETYNRGGIGNEPRQY